MIKIIKFALKIICDKIILEKFSRVFRSIFYIFESEVYNVGNLEANMTSCLYY
jgi:hypothetical protein